jgi:hypothetical protein
VTETEQRLVEGFAWLASVHHEVQHNAMQARGAHDFKSCDAKTCRYAKSIVDWAETQP